jgi:hypothetical protein
MRCAFTNVELGTTLLLAIALTWSAAEAQENTGRGQLGADETEHSILVLHDGGVLTGKISRAADRYILASGGAEMQIASSRVLFACNSLEEAYQRQRQRLTASSAEAHLALAGWCLRYNLLDDAARELTDARSIEAEHPKLLLLERRLAMAKLRPASPSRAVFKVEPSPKLAVTQESPPQADLPAGAVELFTRKVQPVLVNNCTTAGCHRPGGHESFQLDRALLHGLANRRTTTQNLAATLAIVDRAQPELSPLLTIPRRTHGGMQGPVFGPRQEQAFRHLVDWVSLVVPPPAAKPSESEIVEETPALADNHTEPHVAELATTPPFVSQAKGNLPRRNTSSLPRHADVYPTELAAGVEPQSEPVTNAASPVTADDADSSAQRQPLKYGTRLQVWQPKDPFDAEIFNRQQKLREKKMTAAAKANIGSQR